MEIFNVVAFIQIIADHFVLTTYERNARYFAS